MRIATWNMGYWGHKRAHDDAWRWLFDEIQPDIALLQECVVPAWVRESTSVLFGLAYPGSRQAWGTALVSCGLPMAPARLEEVQAWLDGLGLDAGSRSSAARLDSWCVPAMVTLPDGTETLVISIHNPADSIERSLLQGQDLTGIKLKLNRDLWLLDVIFYFLKNRLNRPLLVGGDFNYSRLLDVPRPRGNAEFFDRLQTEGFVSLHRKFHDADERTFFQQRSRHHQLDYLYADPSLGARAKSCRVVPRAEVELFSDHVPLVADLA